VSELRAPGKQGYAGPAQFKTFVTKPDAVPHHDRIFVQGLSAALSAPAQALQTLLYTSLDRLIWNRHLILLSLSNSLYSCPLDQQLAMRPGAMPQSEFSLGRSLWQDDPTKCDKEMYGKIRTATVTNRACDWSLMQEIATSSEV
jgi:hypothetical protein